MKVLITGMRGTVAPAIAERLRKEGMEVVAWDRDAVPAEDRAAGAELIRSVRPDWFLHVATGDPAWAAAVAQVCAEERIRFLFTSSVSVFAGTQQGPFPPEAEPQPDDDYGRYKLHCEQLVRAAHPEALIARLGWQIGDAPGSNTMLDYLTRQSAERGQIEASVNWYPACAFLEDTADAIARLMQGYAPGLYHLDGNPGMSFHEIVSGLSALHGLGWTVIEAQEPHMNNRMLDPHIDVGAINERLGL